MRAVFTDQAPIDVPVAWTVSEDEQTVTLALSPTATDDQARAAFNELPDPHRKALLDHYGPELAAHGIG